MNDKENLLAAGNPQIDYPALEAAAKPKRRWSLARRRRFNATVAKKKASGFTPVTASEWVPQVKHCPFCGGDIQRFLA